jgi:Protein of unknown function (DUF2892)
MEDVMDCNIGRTERVLRGTVGLGLIAIAFVGPQTPWGYLGLVPLVTAIVGWCPPYALFGINTCGARTLKRGGSK